MIFQHSQCFQCFQCSKKRGTPLKIPPHCERSSHQTQRRGAHKFHKGETARQGRQHSAGGAHKLHKGETGTVQGSAQVPQGRNSTAGATAQCRGSAQTPQGRNRHSAGGAHKLHKGETARQGRQHSAEKRTSSAGRQERQLRKAGTRAAGSQKLRLWRSLF